MPTKNVYFFKVSLFSYTPKVERPIGELKKIFNDIFIKNSQNDSIRLSSDNIDTVILDIIENEEEYLFARLSKRRLNNTLQKRDYNTFTIDDVLSVDEVKSKGIELFTYCILWYNNGVLAVVNSKGAPSGNALNRIFELYNKEYYLEILPVPNIDLIRELYDSTESRIKRIRVEVPSPDPIILEQALNTKERDLIDSVCNNTQSVIFTINPQLKGDLSHDSKIIKRMIDVFRKNRHKYNSITLYGKAGSRCKQVGYDLFEEHFKYPIDITEYYQDNNHKVEYPKEHIQADYRDKMMRVYVEFKDIIDSFCDRVQNEWGI